MKKWIIGLIVIGVIGFITFLFISWGIRVNNTMVEMKGQAEVKWSNVESAYQRRNDLIGNLVKTVQGAADFEKSTLTEVINARAKATSTTIDASGLTAANMAQFQQAQAGLSGALSKLLVSVERYPDLKSNQNFLALQNQLEGTENRIKMERDRFNEVTGNYNIYIKKFPNSYIAERNDFEKIALYKSNKGSENAVDVNFDFNKKE